MKLGSIAYGEGQETQAIKSGAPLATTPDVSASQAPQVSAPAPARAEVTPLFAMSQRPGEPVTNGVNAGAGAGANALVMAKSSVKLSDTLAKMLPFDTDGSIAVLYQDALARGN
jgi:hypothetical protein